MPGLLIVQTEPNSPAELGDYHRWYDDVHLPEMTKLDFVTSARRFESLEDGTFVAVYEIAGDVAAAKATLSAAQSSGTMSQPVGVKLDPPPVVQWVAKIDRASR